MLDFLGFCPRRARVAPAMYSDAAELELDNKTAGFCSDGHDPASWMSWATSTAA
jgi:hypothetical protein